MRGLCDGSFVEFEGEMNMFDPLGKKKEASICQLDGQIEGRVYRTMQAQPRCMCRKAGWTSDRWRCPLCVSTASTETQKGTILGITVAPPPPCPKSYNTQNRTV